MRSVFSGRGRRDGRGERSARLNERRAGPRVKVPGRVVAKVRAYVAARVVDISARGIQVELSHSLPPKTICDLRFTKGQGEILLRAEVRRCRVWGMGEDEKGNRALLYRAGLEFSDAPAVVLAKLADVVPEILALDGAAAPGAPSIGVVIEPRATEEKE